MDLLYEDSWNPRLRRHRAQHAFRGVGRPGISLRSGLSRLGGEYAQKERHILRNFRKYARRAYVGEDSLWNWLSLAQHHGLPTRLLDWTYSPLVALHFATADLELYDQDAEVWALNFALTNCELPPRLRELLRAEGSDVFTGEMLSTVADTLDSLDRLAEQPFLLFLEPPSLDDRIVNQSALFSVMSSATADLDEWLAGKPETVTLVRIPAALKWEIRDKLDQANISERFLFPGLDGLSGWLSRYYTERR